MGFRGFFYYIEEHKLCKTIDIFTEVKTWKRRNPDKRPLIVVDFKSLAYCITKEKSEYICGGRHQVTLKCWENILKRLAQTGCKLVFFSDLNMSPSKMKTWMKRQTALFKEYEKFYESISFNKNFDKIIAVNEKKHLKPPNATHHDMEIIAQKYGEFYYSVECENDLELARYAMKNDAFAVISNDFDFLIFDGAWRHWTSSGITEHSMKVTEYNRNGLLKSLKLTRKEMFIFATVWGNDFIKKLFERIDDAAEFARDKSSLSVDEIIRELPGQNIDSKVFQNSLNAFDVSFQPPNSQLLDDDDPFERKLLKTNIKMYKFYMALMSPIQGISLLLYDMNESEPTVNLPELIIKWTQRKIGILHDDKHRSSGNTFKFQVATKTDVNKPFAAFEKAAVYPDPNTEKFVVPPLEQLYLQNQSRSVDPIETNWDILQWIMSFTDSEISTIRNVKKEFRLNCAILCALIKDGLLSEKEADGILCTEYEITDGIQGYAIPPTNLNGRCVRAAQKYNIVFSYVRENFAIAGLLSYIEEMMKFDGVYFQTLMTKFMWCNNAERYKHMRPIKDGVMISDLSKFDLF